MGWFPYSRGEGRRPSSRLTFLGIEIDSNALVLRLPHDKLTALQGQVASWKDRWRCTRSDLQSLARSLQHACKVMRPGRTFLRRVYELLRGVCQNHHHIRLNNGMRSDLAWWDLFLDTWNAVSITSVSRPRALY